MRSFFNRCRFLLALTALLLSGAELSSAHATIYYVSATNGNNSRTLAQATNPTTPWQTITRAIFATADGDTIEVGAGTYPEVLYLNQDLYRTIQAAPGARPLIRPVNSSGWNVVYIHGTSHITLKGLEIDGSALRADGNGIAITGGAHHVTVSDCIVHDCGGGGIFTFNSNVVAGGPGGEAGGSDYITIEDCVVYNCNAWGTGDPSGISLHGNSHFDQAPGFHSIIRRNRIFNNIAKYPGEVHTDGNGIIIDLQNNGPQVLIENNICYNNGGRGIHVYKSQNITIRNNTSYKNCQDPDIKDGELTAFRAANVLFVNNIAVGKGNVPVNAIYQATNITFRYNLYFGGSATYGSWDTYGDPQFRNPGTTIGADFRVLPGSPAINAGQNTAGNFAADDFFKTARPRGAAVDKGAYELLAPIAPTNLSALAGDGSVELSWTPAPDATAYTVKRATNSEGRYTDLVPNSPGTTFTDSGLTNGTPYFYVVSAFNPAGQSPDSTQSSATPFDPNTAPVALGDSFGVAEDGTLNVAAPGLLSNDSDADGNALSVADSDGAVPGVQPISGPFHGALVLNADGSFVYTPSANWSGSDSFSYAVSDGTTLSEAATVSLSVASVNDAPTFSVGANQTLAEDTSAQSVSNWATAISSGPADEAAQTLAFLVTSDNSALFLVAPAIDAAGTLTFTPAPNANGVATVSVALRDNGGGETNTSAAQTFTITISPVNDAPVAASQSLVVNQNTSKTVVLAASDLDNSALSFAIVSGPTRGTLSGTAPNLTYTPAANFLGSDSFSFRASDGAAQSNTATISLSVVSTKPTITGFSPTSGKAGDAVTLSGTNLSGATVVKLGSLVLAVGTFSANSAGTQISLTVPPNAVTGKWSVTTSFGSSASAGTFTVTSPALTAFSPASGPEGTMITLTGAKFSNPTSVRFGGVAATNVIFLSATRLRATVPSGALTGQIGISTASGESATSAKIFKVTPKITGFSPPSGAPGTLVSITGTTLGGATSVKFGNVAASFTVVAPTEISAVVPGGAVTGLIKITTPDGTASSAANFVVAPRISKFSPTGGVAGIVVTLTGANFGGATSVEFNGLSAGPLVADIGAASSGFQIVSSTSIKVKVPVGATTGKIGVVSPAGTGLSATNFLVSGSGAKTSASGAAPSGGSS